MTYDVQALREREFAWASRGECIYLNNASTGPLPRRTLEAIGEFNRKRSRPWEVSDEDQFGVLRRGRELVARLIGSSPADVALMVNTTYGINIAARCLPLRSGDVVVAHDREFPANVYPWAALERMGVGFVRVPTVDGMPDDAALERAMDGRGVRAVTTSWVQFSTGHRADLERIGRLCRERGLFFVVDAIQGLGAAPLDVRQCGVDVLACGGQKWLLSPWGSGFVYVKPELVQSLEPSVVGWMATRGTDDFTRLVDYDFAWHDDARRFEVITLPYQDFAGFNESVALLHELGPEAIAAHIEGIVDQAVAWTLERSDLRLVTPADRRRRAGIISIAPRDPPAASERLTRSGIAHSLREGAVRLSPHCYNTPEEMMRALGILAGDGS